MTDRVDPNFRSEDVPPLSMEMDPLTRLQSVPVKPLAEAGWKRVLDLVLAGFFLLLTFPLWLILMAAIKLTSPGPVLYRSKRIGLGGKEFFMFKFRSMYIDADARLKDLLAQNDHDGPIFKMRNDPRITPVGGFIRRFSLDEFPQFLNVLRGELSMVGPRALHEYELVAFDDRGIQRLSVKPGITCYWQIMGRSDLDYEASVDLDHRYMNEASLWTDLKIIAKTPGAVLKGRGAY